MTFSSILNVILLNYQGVIQKVRVVVVNIDHQHEYNNIIMLYMYMFMKVLHKELTHERSSMLSII